MRLWSRLAVVLGAHLGDDELLELLMPARSEPSSAAAQTHLERCEVCAQRSVTLQTFMNGLAETNETTVARALPLDRLATQRERIMRRLRRSVEPAPRGRVLSFPALARPTLAHVHHVQRRLGAAAASGLLIGATVGQFLHVHPDPAMTTTGTSVDAPAMASPLARPSGASFTLPAPEDDDPFLDELELMLSRPQVPELSPLDEITPRIREAAVNLW